MGTVMAKLVVTSIVEESVPVELQAALFDMKQAVEGVCAASRLVPLARALVQLCQTREAGDGVAQHARLRPHAARQQTAESLQQR